jgi:hypothetical protein
MIAIKLKLSLNLAKKSVKNMLDVELYITNTGNCKRNNVNNSKTNKQQKNTIKGQKLV